MSKRIVNVQLVFEADEDIMPDFWYNNPGLDEIEDEIRGCFENRFVNNRENVFVELLAVRNKR